MQNNTALILDTETHKLNGRAIEIAHYPLELSSGVLSFQRDKAYSQRFNPQAPICVQAMAVHNILESDIAEMPPYTSFELPSDVLYIVGHNIDYDIRTLKRGGIKQSIRPIDTLSLARRYIPEAPAHSIAVLSYFLCQDKERLREKLKHAHSALADIDLTASLLRYLVRIIPKEHTTSLECLFQHSLDCRIPRLMPMGEHKGKTISLVPDSYKRWLINKTDDVYLRYALELDQASHRRRAFEVKNNLPENELQNYQFTYNAYTPNNRTKSQEYDWLLEKALEIEPE